MAWFAASVAAAHAHAAFIGSEPADGTMVSVLPAEALLRFSEPVRPLVLKLIRPDGSMADLAGARLQGNDLTVPLPAETVIGTYMLSWRVTSLDGHPVGGAFVFGLGAAPSHTAQAAEESAPGLGTAIYLVRVFLYVGLLIGIGAPLFHALTGTALAPSARPLLWLLPPLAMAALGLQGMDALASSWTSLLTLAPWQAGLATSYGATALLLAAAGMLALLKPRPFAPLAAVLAALALALSGHAAAAPPQWLTRPTLFLHVLCLILWIGALLPLAILIQRSSPEAPSALARFSTWIPLPLVLVLASGTVLALIQVPHLADLWQTAYGRTLLAKLALVSLVLAIAAVNRFVLTAGAGAGDRPAMRRLARTITAETLLVLLILGVVAGWRFTPPPRSLAAAASAISQHVMNDRAMAQIVLNPGRSGSNVLSITLHDPKGEPLAALEVTVAIANPGAGIEPIRRSAVREAGDRWNVEGLVLPMAGGWTLTIDVLVSDFEAVKLETSLDLPP
jgi:copper transport protein